MEPLFSSGTLRYIFTLESLFLSWVGNEIGLKKGGCCVEPTVLEDGDTSISETFVLTWFSLLLEIFLLIAAKSSFFRPSGLSKELPKIPKKSIIYR